MYLKVWYKLVIPDVVTDWSTIKLSDNTDNILSLKDAIIRKSRELQLPFMPLATLAATNKADDPNLALPLDSRLTLRETLNLFHIQRDGQSDVRKLFADEIYIFVIPPKGMLLILYSYINSYNIESEQLMD